MTEWLLLCACYLYALKRGVAHTSFNEPKKVLIVQMAKLGDMVCTTPMFRAIKHRYPNVQVTVMGNAINRELLTGNTDVDSYIIWSGIRNTIKQLRRGHYDFASITSPSAPLLAVLYLSGARMIVAPRIENGRSPNDTLAYRLLTRLCHTRPHQMRHYAPREYLRLLEPVGINSDDATKRLAYSSAARERIASFLHEQHLRADGRLLIGVAPSAGHKTKEWFPERFAEVITELKKKYPVDIVLVGSKGDMVAGEAVKKYLPDASITDTCGMFSVEEAKALIASLDMLLSVDTGPVYVAEAFGVPTVDITGPIDEHEQPPIGDMHLVVPPPPPREPQLFVMNAREYDMAEVKRQLDSITASMVLDACKTLIERIMQRRSRDTTRTFV